MKKLLKEIGIFEGVKKSVLERQLSVYIKMKPIKGNALAFLGSVVADAGGEKKELPLFCRDITFSLSHMHGAVGNVDYFVRLLGAPWVYPPSFASEKTGKGKFNAWVF